MPAPNWASNCATCSEGAPNVTSATRGDKARARASARIPLGRYGEPDEFGRVAAFVLSPAAAYVTGTLIAVDGGVTRQP